MHKKFKDIQQNRNARIKELKQVSNAAKECLENDLFIKYKKQYDDYERQLTDMMLDYPANDPEYNRVMVKYLAELKILRMLGKNIEEEAGLSNG